ncbi:MAG: DUF3419 family protein [Burkholderiales bacterium]
MRMAQSGGIQRQVFDWLYRRSLVYNACWEDPAVDRRALALTGNDVMLAITSAGCNVLDYALAGARQIHAVDANPRQTALLELKIAGIRRIEFEDFFRLFGDGRHPRARFVYGAMRTGLSPFARGFWDRHIDWFGGGVRPSFYFYGLAGMVATAFRAWFAVRPALRRALDELMAASTLAEQREVYDRRVAPLLWGRGVLWFLDRQMTMNLLGVPAAQSAEVRAQHPEGISGFVRDSLGHVLRSLPFRDNYFWSLYLRGAYTPACCPEYLKPRNFGRLRAGVVDAIEPHTDTVTRFLQGGNAPISRFVLLDHMDWMSSVDPAGLAEEWEAILGRAAPGARIIFRSAHSRPAYLSGIRVRAGEAMVSLPEALRFQPRLAAALSRRDRVNTYAGFHIADVPA